MKLHRFTICEIEWNVWNGLMIELFGIETDNTEGCLFALYGVNKGIYLNLLYFIKLKIAK